MNRIILSRPLVRKLAELPKLYEESVGVLFAKINNGTEFYSSLRGLGTGSPGMVSTDGDYTKVANTIIENDLSVTSIEFHTHSRGTIEKYGSVYAKNFSHGDLHGDENWGGISSQPVGYKHLLVTPKTMKLIEITGNGIKEREFEVMDFIRQDEWSQYFTNIFEFYRKKLGVPHKSFSAHRFH